MWTNWLVLSDWATALINVYADVIGWSNWDVIKLQLKNIRDIRGTESDSNTPISISKDNTLVYFKSFTIESWKTLLTKVSSSPIISTLAANTDNAEVLRFKVNSPSEIVLDSLNATVSVRNNSASSVSTSDLFRTIKLYECTSADYSTCSIKENFEFTNMTVNSWATSTFTAKAYLSNIAKGDKYYAVKVDIWRNASSNIDFSVALNNTSLVNPENTQGETIISSNIAWSADSNYWSIWSVWLIVSYSNSETLEFVKGKQNIPAWTVTITPNNVEDMRLNSLRLKFEWDSGINWNQIINVQLFNGTSTTALASADVDSNWNVSFDNLRLDIPKSKQMELKVTFDTTTSLYAGTSTKNMTFKVSSSSSSDILLTTKNWSVIASSRLSWLPLLSNTIVMYPTAKMYIYRDTNIIKSQIIYDRNLFTEAYSFKLKSKFDDVRIKDMFIVAYSGTLYNWTISSSNIIPWTQSYISRVKFIWSEKTVEAPMIDGIARFDNLDDTLKANQEKTMKISLQPSNIDSIAKTNKNVKLAMIIRATDSSSNTYSTRFISLSNGEILDNTSVENNDNLLSNTALLRKGMLQVNSKIDSTVDTKLTNGAEHTLYKWEVKNLGNNTTKVKQFALPISITNWGTSFNAYKYKLEISTNDGNSWTSWTSIKDKVHFAQWTNIATWDWMSTNADDENISIATASTLSTYLYVRFAWDWNNWYDINGKSNIQFRIKAVVEWVADNGDSMRVEMKPYVNTLTDWVMTTYDTFETSNNAKEMVVWTDNADSDGQTSITDTNWFEDFSTEWSMSSNTLTKSS